MNVRLLSASLIALFVAMTHVSCSDDEQIFNDDKPCNLDALKDKTTSPGDDFYHYCNGNWYDNVVIPEGKTRCGFMQDEQYLATQTLLNEQRTNPTLPLFKTLKSDFERRAETKESDYALIRSYLDDIDRQTTMHDLLVHAGRLMRQDIPTLLTPDFFVQNKKVKVTLDYAAGQYLILSSEILCQLGYTWAEANEMIDNAEELNDDMYEIEKKSNSLQADRNAPVTDEEYNLAVSHLSSRASNADDNISTMLSGMGLSRDMLFYYINNELGIYNYLNKLTDKQLIAARDYIKIAVAEYMIYKTAYSSQKFENAFGNIKYVQPVLGKLFAETHQTSQSKQYIETMCENIRASLINRIGRLDWMVDNTKRAAAEKVADMQFFCCYPDNWNDALVNPTVTSKSYLQDFLELGKQYNGIFIGHCGHTDRDAIWDAIQIIEPMHDLNACYLPGSNFIVITSAISCPPLVDVTKSDAYNYGQIAAAIGHEMTHGLDSSGSKYDKDGNFSVWWTMDDKLKFIERQKQLVTIYNNLVVVPGIFQNGEQTLGENIADLGGLLAAYDSFVALRKSQGCKGEELNAQKRLFLESFANLWREKRTLSSYQEQQKVDVHANGICRINGVVCNHPDWYMLYDVRPNHKLYLAPERRVSIW